MVSSEVIMSDNVTGASEVAQRVKVLTAKPDDLRLVRGTHMTEENQFPFSDLHMHTHTHTHRTSLSEAVLLLPYPNICFS